MAMVVITLARHMGVLTNSIINAQAMIMSGMAVKTTFVYSFNVLSVRSISDATKAKASVL